MIPPENENAEIPYDMLKEVMYSFYTLQRMLLFSENENAEVQTIPYYDMQKFHVLRRMLLFYLADLDKAGDTSPSWWIIYQQKVNRVYI